MPLTCTPSAVLNSGKRKQYKAPCHKQTILPGERVQGGVKFDVACLSRACLFEATRFLKCTAQSFTRVTPHRQI